MNSIKAPLLNYMLSVTKKDLQIDTKLVNKSVEKEKSPENEKNK